MKILIADDDERIHEVYRCIFHKSEPMVMAPQLLRFIPSLVDFPYHKATAHNLTLVKQGEQAIVAIDEAMAAGCPFDIAILDVRMPPGISGVAVAKVLRANHPDVMIVICTAFADFTWTDLLELFPRGVSLIRKPFDYIEFIMLLTSLEEKIELVRENRNLRKQMRNNG
jgi:CheY-like chemotaxis protein